MKHKQAQKWASLLICIAVLLTNTAFISLADSDPLPAPDWVSITSNRDGSKTLSINTPSYMLDAISYYEYSTDSGLSWETLNDNTGGEFVFDSTTEFSLRYIHSGFRSAVYTVTVEISKYTTLTSSTGITLLVPFDSELPPDITLSTYEIISGSDYTSAGEFFGKNRPYRLFNVFLLRNNRIYDNTIVNSWYFPVGDLNIDYCKIYRIDSDGNFTEIESAAEFNVLLCSTDKTGLFAVVEDKSYSRGDVNGDAAVTAMDARLTLRYAAQLEEFSAIQLAAADVNSDARIASSDARTILRISAKIES